MRPYKRALLQPIFLSGFVMMGTGGGVWSDEDRANVSGPPRVSQDMKAIKAALETLKNRLSNVEFDALQRADELQAIHDELAAIRNRGAQTLKSPPELKAPSPASPATYSLLPSDVTTTGAIGRAAAPPRTQAPAIPQVAGPVTTSIEAQQLLKADDLLGKGDIVGAMLLLEYALRAGNPFVAFKLAETYDPARLAALRVVGVRGDAHKAQQLYQQAHAGGVQQARERVSNLRH
jgi:hypothetical protein